MNGLVKLGEVLGPMRDIARIKPPGKSLDDWERFLRESAEVALDSPLGFAIMKRKRWLNRARATNITYEAAERAWDGSAPHERPETEDEINALLDHASEVGL